MTLVKFNPEKKNNALMPGFNDIFETFFNDSFLSDRVITRVPAANISETPDHFHIELAAPGLKKEDFKLQLDHSVLSVSVEQHTENTNNQRNYNKREYSYNSFVRSFTLPESADDARIEAEYVNGILTVNIAKKEEAKTASRQIAVK